MGFLKSFRNQLFKGELSFEELALALFRHQSENNAVYKDFIYNLKINPIKVDCIEDIPFLPISFFKSHQIRTGDWSEEVVFESSGTTGSVPSRHFLDSLSWYENVSKRDFEQFYGALSNYKFLALLPSYLERQTSSLVYMVDHFMRVNQDLNHGFYLNEWEKLNKKIIELDQKKEHYLLLGVSFALLDFAEKINQPIKYGVVMETGGMKGRRAELTRAELHNELKKKFGVDHIHSEYGMTELMSQAYAQQDGRFYCPPWMRVLARELTDPLTLQQYGLTGGLNIIDLANVHSCAFIATEDIGKCYADQSFEVLGRFDNSETRGCNLMV